MKIRIELFLFDLELQVQPQEIIDKSLASGLKKLRDIFQKEKVKAENEDAYNEIRLQMHNRLIKKLRSLKEEWKLDNISQVTERIMLAFFKKDIKKIFCKKFYISLTYD